MVQNLSPEFIAENKQVHAGRFKGTLKFDPVHSGYTGFDFTAEDILDDSVMVNATASSSNDVTIGGVFLGTLKITFLPSVVAGREASDYWTQSMISLYYEEYTGQGLTGWEEVKVGDYYVKNAVYQSGMVSLTAYDGMCLFDVPVIGSISGTPYQLLDTAVQRCTFQFDISLHLGITQAEIQQMPNGTMTFSAYWENDIETYRDLLFWIAQSLGGFAYVDRTGGLMIRSYLDYYHEDNPVTEIDYTERIANTSQIYDYLAYYDGVKVNDLANDTTEEVFTGTNLKLYDLGNNPFWQKMADMDKGYFLSDLAYVVNTCMRIRPYRVQMRSAPIYDIGDKIGFKRGDWAPWQDTSDPVISIIHYWEFTKDTLTIAAYGAKRTSISTASRSGSSGGTSGTGKAKTVEYFTYVNDSDISLDTIDDPVVLGSVDFYVEQATYVEALAQLNPEHAGGGSWAYEYIWDLDGEPSFGAEVKGGDERKNVDTLTHIEQILTPGLHTLTLKGKKTAGVGSSATYTADEGVKIILKGQGLSTDTIWSGILIMMDNWTKIKASQATKVFSESEPLLTFLTPDPSLSFSDAWSQLQAGQSVNALSATYELTFENP